MIHLPFIYAENTHALVIALIFTLLYWGVGTYRETI